MLLTYAIEVNSRRRSHAFPQGGGRPGPWNQIARAGTAVTMPLLMEANIRSKSSHCSPIHSSCRVVSTTDAKPQGRTFCLSPKQFLFERPEPLLKHLAAETAHPLATSTTTTVPISRARYLESKACYDSACSLTFWIFEASHSRPVEGIHIRQKRHQHAGFQPIVERR